MEEDMMMKKKQTQTSMATALNSPSTCTLSSSSGAANYNNSLPMHKKSRTIAKPKPKIRIIHIFAPEIIKTDPANFQELVQRLTGRDSSAGKKAVSSVKEELESNHFQMWNHNNNSFGGGFLGGFADLDVGFNVHEFGEFSFLPLDAPPPPPHTMHVFDRLII